MSTTLACLAIVLAACTSETGVNSTSTNSVQTLAIQAVTTTSTELESASSTEVVVIAEATEKQIATFAMQLGLDRSCAAEFLKPISATDLRLVGLYDEIVYREWVRMTIIRPELPVFDAVVGALTCGDGPAISAAQLLAGFEPELGQCYAERLEADHDLWMFHFLRFDGHRNLGAIAPDVINPYQVYQSELVDRLNRDESLFELALSECAQESGTDAGIVEAFLEATSNEFDR